MNWDIFCKVIDNHGDAGVCWRLASELARRGDSIRLWIDDPKPLKFMAPQGQAGVEVISWNLWTAARKPGDVVVEAFGCDLPEEFVTGMTKVYPPPAWINLEHLSAEAYVERSHGLPSPVAQGPGKGLPKHFFYPGFTKGTGGLPREQGLEERMSAFDRKAWLQQWGVDPDQARVFSLFCYEPAALRELLGQLANGDRPTELLITDGRAAEAVRRISSGDVQGNLHLRWLPLLSQYEYDHLLWASDLNFVRGEDSIVRGLLAWVPCIWQLYPQEDAAHHAKVEAFLAWLRPPPDLAAFYRRWNGMGEERLPAIDLANWGSTAAEAAIHVEALPELVTGLREFATARGRI